MADRANAILATPDGDWRKMSDAAYAKATSYSWSDAVDRFEAALNEAAQAPGAAAPEAQARGCASRIPKARRSSGRAPLKRTL
jgi:hypothetical protein